MDFHNELEIDNTLYAAHFYNVAKYFNSDDKFYKYVNVRTCNKMHLYKLIVKKDKCNFCPLYKLREKMIIFISYIYI